MVRHRIAVDDRSERLLVKNTSGDGGHENTSREKSPVKFGDGKGDRLVPRPPGEGWSPSGDDEIGCSGVQSRAAERSWGGVSVERKSGV